MSHEHDITSLQPLDPAGKVEQNQLFRLFVVGLTMLELNLSRSLSRFLSNKFKVLEVAVFSLWYLAMFPGRLGFDNSEAIRMIQRGESTDLWSSTFFWYLKIVTFWGESIILASLISYLLLSFSLKYFILGLPGDIRILRRSYLIVLATPIVSVFGLTVSHDAFQVSGILLLVGYHLRQQAGLVQSENKSLLLVFIAYASLMTTHFGLIVIFLDLIFKVFQKLRIAAILSVLVSLLFTLSSFGITKHDPSARTTWMVADLKCVAQHSEARLSDSDWIFLQTIAPKQEWTAPLSCTTVDEPVGTLKSRNKEALHFNVGFAENYLKIVLKNPAIVGMAHIQRSRGALPPPFFQGPDNQVELDPSVPIGLGTNIALQNSFEMLHPSVDEPSVDVNLTMLKPLELIAQALTFTVNQASWFWGWGGLWLWPLIYFFISRIQARSLLTRIKALSPLLLLHFLLVAIGPAPLTRYVMAAVIMGMSTTTLLFMEWLDRTGTKLRFTPTSD
jgi:hypothetical protein